MVPCVHAIAMHLTAVLCSGNLSVRTYHGGDQGSMAIEDVISRVQSAVKAKSSFS